MRSLIITIEGKSVRIGHPRGTKHDLSTDMGMLLEALSLNIRQAEKEKIIQQRFSVQKCQEHLNNLLREDKEVEKIKPTETVKFGLLENDAVFYYEGREMKKVGETTAQDESGEFHTINPIEEVSKN